MFTYLSILTELIRKSELLDQTVILNRRVFKVFIVHPMTSTAFRLKFQIDNPR